MPKHLRLKKVIQDEIDAVAGEFVKADPEFAWDIQETFCDPVVQRAVERVVAVVLEDYTNWLHETGYTDSDVYVEEPTAIERYNTAYARRTTKEDPR